MIGKVYFLAQTVKSFVWEVARFMRLPAAQDKLLGVLSRKNASVAVFHQGGIGSGLLFGSMLQILRSRWPGCVIHLFSWQSQEGELLSACGLVDQFWTVPRDGFREFFRQHRERYGLLLSASRTIDGDRVARVIPAEVKVGFFHTVGWHRRSALYHDIAVAASGQEHEAQADAFLLQPLFLDLGKVPQELLPREGTLFSARGGRQSLSTKQGDPTILFSPGSGKNLNWKRYPLQKMIETASFLNREIDARCVFLLGPDEKDMMQTAAQENVSGIEVVHAGSFLETFHLLRSVDCVVANDGAVMHLASAAGAKLVAIFGPTNPSLCGPWGDESRTRVLRLPLYCSPCYRFYSGSLNCVNQDYLHCLNAIQTKDLANAVLELLGTARGVEV